MEIALYHLMEGRPCRFCLCLQGASVFADFDVDDGLLYAVRVSFDGFGCCTTPADIARMTVQDSAALLGMVERGSLEGAEAILRRYFRRVRDVVWEDALERHDLL